MRCVVCMVGAGPTPVKAAAARLRTDTKKTPSSLAEEGALNG